MSLKRCVILCLCLCLQSARADELAPLDVRELDAVPDGNYLTILWFKGSDWRLNLKVDQGAARCVNTNYQSAEGLSVSFQPLGNGVFLGSMRGDGIAATQFWVFKADGKAEIKEVPDRGEKQIAIPVTGDGLEFPKDPPVADGHLLVKLQVAGKVERLNLKVADNKFTCVASTDPSLAGVTGQFGSIGNRVYLASLEGDDYRATQFWAFDDEGRAEIKEIPDRGEDQQAIPVKDVRLSP